jgi:hypothetical protein
VEIKMPLPKPGKGEERGKFISRCISFAVDDGMPQEQAVAACHEAWRRKGKTKQALNLKFNYTVPIEERGIIDGSDFVIEGIAINPTTTTNNHKFIGEELKKAAKTLNGVPLLIDHKNEVNAVKGRVIEGEFNETLENVKFRAKVVDDETKSMIRNGLINSVSVGATVEKLEETEDGLFIPKDIIFRELSLVAVPADERATFTIALKEAYDKTHVNEPDVFSDVASTSGYSFTNCKEVRMAEEEKNETEETTEEKPAEPEESVEEKFRKAQEKLKELELAELEKQIKQKEKSLKESDVDEVKPEEPKPEPKEEPEEEPEEESEVEEGYKVEQSYGRFSIVRKDNRKKLFYDPNLLKV